MSRHHTGRRFTRCGNGYQGMAIVRQSLCGPKTTDFTQSGRRGNPLFCCGAATGFPGVAGQGTVLLKYNPSCYYLYSCLRRFYKGWRPGDPLHNSLRHVINRTRAACRVVFFVNSGAIDCKKTPCSPSRSGCHRLARVMQRIPRTLALRPLQQTSAACRKAAVFMGFVGVIGSQPRARSKVKCNTPINLIH